MQIINILVVVLVLVTKNCHAKIVVPNLGQNDAASRLDEMLVKIVTSCYEGRIDAVGMIGNVSNSLVRTLSAQYLIPVALVSDAKKTSNIRVTLQSPKFHHKLHLFVAEVFSGLQLNMIVYLNIEYLMWKNHMASWLLLDRSPECSNAKRLLITAWQLNMLNAKVICHYHRVGTIIFDYNPYTSQAPNSWKFLKAYYGINRHPFTVFYWIYPENKTMCVDLDFDKAKDAGGYQISVEGEPRGTYVHDRNLGFYEASLWRTNSRIIDMVYHSLKVTPTYTGLYRNNLPESVDLDIRRSWYLNQDTLKTYPSKYVEVVFITQFRGHKTQLQKILSVVDVESRLGIGIVFLITLIFLKFVVHQALVPTLLNLVRITCNTGLKNMPNDIAPTIYLAGLLFFVVTMQGIFQGNLASLLTKIIPLRNVDTMEDLLTWGYKIYGTEGTNGVIEYPGLKARYITIDDIDMCITNVVHDPLAACIECAEGITLDLAQKFDLHLSTKFVKNVYYGYEINRNWPLGNQINKILGKIMEADIFEPWDVRCNPLNLANFEFDKDVKQNVDFKNIELGEVMFAFIILFIGLGVATIIFILEVAIYSYSCKVANVTVQILN